MSVPRYVTFLIAIVEKKGILESIFSGYKFLPPADDETQALRVPPHSVAAEQSVLGGIMLAVLPFVVAFQLLLQAVALFLALEFRRAAQIVGFSSRRFEYSRGFIFCGPPSSLCPAHLQCTSAEDAQYQGSSRGEDGDEVLHR